MKMRKDFEMAVNALNALKNNYEPVRTEDLAAYLDVSRPFLEQIMRKLRIGGFVVATRGPNGGYNLSKNDPNAFEVAKCLGLAKEPRVTSDTNSPSARLAQAVHQ